MPDIVDFHYVKRTPNLYAYYPSSYQAIFYYVVYQGGWLPPPLLEFVIRHPMPMTLVPVVSYDPPLTSDTKQVPTYQVYDVTAMKI